MQSIQPSCPLFFHLLAVCVATALAMGPGHLQARPLPLAVPVLMMHVWMILAMLGSSTAVL
jgi:hypothetical protein